MEEIWKYIKGYEGLYQVSSYGKIKNTQTNKLLNPYEIQKGYLQVGLCKKGKQRLYLVHRLVAFAFLPEIYNKTEINHKDGNKLNNCVDNLEWVTRTENLLHAAHILKKGKTPMKVKCVETSVIYNTLYEAAKANNCIHTHICACCKGKRKTTGGYHWEYAYER